jgi:cob(I)alamin adenosyltransferase
VGGDYPAAGINPVCNRTCGDKHPSDVAAAAIIALREPLRLLWALMALLCAEQRALREERPMVERYRKMIERYEQQQVKLRGQISMLKAGTMRAGSKRGATANAAAIRRIERQIADLERAIARCREKVQGSRTQ